jgi:hypothetical protein
MLASWGPFCSEVAIVSEALLEGDSYNSISLYFVHAQESLYNEECKLASPYCIQL